MRPFRVRAGSCSLVAAERSLQKVPRTATVGGNDLSPRSHPGRRSLTAAPFRARQRARRRSSTAERGTPSRAMTAGRARRASLCGPSARRYACRPDSALMGRPTTSGSPPDPSAALTLCRHAARTAPDVFPPASHTIAPSARPTAAGWASSTGRTRRRSAERTQGPAARPEPSSHSTFPPGPARLLQGRRDGTVLGHPFGGLSAVPRPPPPTCSPCAAIPAPNPPTPTLRTGSRRTPDTAGNRPGHPFIEAHERHHASPAPERRPLADTPQPAPAPSTSPPACPNAATLPAAPQSGTTGGQPEHRGQRLAAVGPGTDRRIAAEPGCWSVTD
jgi:hypothetical protein